jgi:hypothetical protein
MNNFDGSTPSVVVTGGVEGSAEVEQVADDAAIVDGLELDASGRDRGLVVRDGRQFPDGPMAARCTARSGSEPVMITVRWALAQLIDGVRWVEGSASERGGWAEDVTVEARIEGAWAPMSLRMPYEPGPTRAFEIHTLLFDEAVRADGVRVRAKPGGSAHYLTLCELDGVRVP